MGCALFLYGPMFVWAAAGPHGGPTVLLAFLLPLVLALASWSLRQLPLLPAWAFALIPAMIGLGGLSAGVDNGQESYLFPIAFVCAGLFAWFGRREPKVAVPLAVLAGLALLVAWFSGGRGSGSPMDSWFLRHGFLPWVAGAATWTFRKTVHLTFYGTVALTALLAARGAGAKRSEAVRTAMLAALAVAACDELRQSGYANRSGSPWDVLLDLAGAAAFVGLSEWRRGKTR